MNDLRTAAQQALEALEEYQSKGAPFLACDGAVDALRAALAQQAEGGGNLPPPLQEPKDFDHGIGADRFRVVRGAYWWHILIGDSPIKRGKFHTKAGAEEMAVLLLREFRNGAFVQHNTAPPQRKPLTEEVAALTAQRDALLEALRDLVQLEADGRTEYESAIPHWDAARAAIKAVEETK